MSEPTSAAGLHEYMDAEINLSEPPTPAQEQSLRDTLGKRKGVQSVTISREKVSINYEAIFVAEKELLAVVEGADLKIKDAKATSSSPLTEAFEQKLQPRGQDPSLTSDGDVT